MSSESDFESEYDLSDGEQVQQQDPPHMQTVQLQPASPTVRLVQQTSGQNSGDLFHDDNRLNAGRASYAEERCKKLQEELNNAYNRLFSLEEMYQTLQEVYKTLEEENKTLKAQLATQKQATSDSLRW